MTRPFRCRPSRIVNTIAVQYIQRYAHAPLRPAFPFLPTAKRTFSTSRPCRADSSHGSGGAGKTHYEVLGVPHDASVGDIKKQFYALSRSTHPDIHPNDPTASERFSQISESYHTLSDPVKRQRYDQDVIGPLQQQQGRRPGSHRGSYAGSRPASGLSKRRGTFRGPPPSFYAQGGYGSTETQRDKAGPGPGFEAGAAGSEGSTDNANDNGNTGGFGPGRNNSNADFDSSPTYRTQTAEDVRRMTRRQAALAAAQDEMKNEQDFWVRVVVVLGIFFGAVVLGGVISRSKVSGSDDIDFANGRKEERGGKDGKGKAVVDAGVKPGRGRILGG